MTNTSSTTPINNNPSSSEFIDQISDTKLIPTAVGMTATSGTISFNASSRTFSWNGSIPPSGSVTLTFFARITTNLRLLGVNSQACNQGKAIANGTEVLTKDPTPLPGTGDPAQTCSVINLRPVDSLQALWLPAQQVIRFAALSTGIKEINVQVFGLSGKRVYASGWVGNGYEWKLQDKTGKAVANGVYLYVVTVCGYDGTVRTQVKKLVIKR
ncbi:hypothetical protein HY230_05360 [Candidatus Acetothermia bacterium]|nr:hypothetical protein [Candidatus Acetothermia bacterium]